MFPLIKKNICVATSSGRSFRVTHSSHRWVIRTEERDFLPRATLVYCQDGKYPIFPGISCVWETLFHKPSAVPMATFSGKGSLTSIELQVKLSDHLHLSLEAFSCPPDCHTAKVSCRVDVRCLLSLLCTVKGDRLSGIRVSYSFQIHWAPYEGKRG